MYEVKFQMSDVLKRRGKPCSLKIVITTAFILCNGCRMRLSTFQCNEIRKKLVKEIIE